MSKSKTTEVPPSESLQQARSRRAALRREFIDQIGSIEPFQQMFNQIPGLHFCVKDAQSRLIWGNDALFQRLNVHEDDMVCTDDDQYFPAHIAEDFIRDDQMVLSTGKPLLNRVAVWYNQQRILDWFVKNKFPLRNRAGKVIGLIVSIQSYEGMKHAHTSYADLSRVIDYIRHHLGEDLTMDHLAKLGGVSPRQLHRRFKGAFGLSVQEFLMRTRIQAAQDSLIHTSRSLADIAQSFGFCDQSAFTQQFRKSTGMTPRKFRLRYTVHVARV
ncbi:MAG: helix-turn-helix domain-containing protein [Opitutaceae bacterium]